VSENSAQTIESLCDLPEDQRLDRIARVQREILPRVRVSEELADGFALEFDADMRERVEQLVTLERQCCSSIDWQVEEARSRPGVRLEVRGVDPRRGAFAELFGQAGNARADGPAAGSLTRVAKAGGIGVGAALLICCVLPIGAAAIGGAALAAPLAGLDQPVIIGATALAAGAFAWRRGSKRAAESSCEAGC